MKTAKTPTIWSIVLGTVAIAICTLMLALLLFSSYKRTQAEKFFQNKIVVSARFVRGKDLGTIAALLDANLSISSTKPTVESRVTDEDIYLVARCNPKDTVRGVVWFLRAELIEPEQLRGHTIDLIPNGIIDPSGMVYSVSQVLPHFASTQDGMPREAILTMEPKLRAVQAWVK